MYSDVVRLIHTEGKVPVDEMDIVHYLDERIVKNVD